MLENNPDPNELSRIELLNLAHSLHISDADVMTRAELRTAIEKARKPEPKPPEQPVTWVSVARRLLASIVEQGLNLPDAAALIRGDTKLSTPPKAPPPVATVTLARIYAAQGHLDRAIRTLDEVLASDPDHHPALQLRAQLQTRLEEQRRSADAASAAAADNIDAGAALDDLTPVATAPGEAPGAAKPGDTAPPETIPEPTPMAAETTFAAETAAPAESLTPAASALEGHEGSPLSNGMPRSAANPDAAGHSEPPDAPAPGPASHPSSEIPPAPLAGVLTAATPELVAHPPVEVPIHVALADAPTDLPGAHAGAVAILTPEASPPARQPEAPVAEAPASRPLPLPEEKTVAAAAVSPAFPGLVVIETDAPSAYVYWEISAPNGPELAHSPCWISVVTYTPTKRGSERRERRIPVFHSAGALRIEGVPTQAVLRAKLAREQTSEAPPLAVASTVRASSPALADLQPRFTPHARANPQALTHRAAPYLDNASAVYW